MLDISSLTKMMNDEQYLIIKGNKYKHMKNSLIACAILFCSMSFAQDLFVDTGSYVFVDGTAFTSGPGVAPLYVTNDIALATDGNIYLRNEAQLLQGDTFTSTNAGEGVVSVYQTGNVNQWAYNYWCSPVGNNSALEGNETARVNLLKDATNIASPGDPLGLTSWAEAAFIGGYNGVASPLQIARRWLYTYVSSSTYASWDFVDPTDPINTGLGFTMKGSGTGAIESTLYDFRGKPNNGTISNTVGEGDFTLVGNPYPSAMDSAAFVHDPQNALAIVGTLFYWEQNTSIPETQSHVLQDYVGGYSEFTIDPLGVIISNTPATFYKYDEQDNVLDTVGPPIPPIGAKTAQRYVPIGQGFMVEGIIGTSGLVRAKNEHRVFEKLGAQSNFFRNNDSSISNDNSKSNSSEIQFQDNGLPIIPDDYMRFRINVEFTVDATKYVRQMLLNFHDNATMSYDRGLELHRSSNLNSDAYFVQEDDIFSGLAFPFIETLKIPLVVDIEQQQPLRFRIFDIQNFDEAQGIYMHDKENDTYVNLRNLDYELNIAPGNYTDRFEIVFTSEAALAIDESDINTLTINQNNGLGKLLVLNPKRLDISSIEVYDVSGKRLLQGVFDAMLNRYELSTAGLSDGVYVVNVISQTSAVKSQKIIVKN